MKKVEPQTDVGKVSLIQWLKINDPEFLEIAEKTAHIFGPLASFAYKNKDDKVQENLYQHMKAEYVRHQE
ncbi:MAG: hypothetical protein KZQ94_16055 [Candidatus Thiodiazotropha sp. (ex Troendleina suluensis)]|nr:hypothetical protein [Candidatus Thiodiazotropha sp. (ex Troendleina suluensis)]